MGSEMCIRDSRDTVSGNLLNSSLLHGTSAAPRAGWVHTLANKTRSDAHPHYTKIGVFDGERYEDRHKTDAAHAHYPMCLEYSVEIVNLCIYAFL